MNDIPTPRTDEACRNERDGSFTNFVPVYFARQLEKELQWALCYSGVVGKSNALRKSEEYCQLAIHKATEQLQAELKFAESEQRRWATAHTDLQAAHDANCKTVAELTKEVEALKTSFWEAENGKYGSSEYHRQVQELQAENAKLKDESAEYISRTDPIFDKLEESDNLVLEMREALEAQLTSTLARINRTPDAFELAAKADTLRTKALSLTTPLANNFIKREEYEKVVEALRNAKETSWDESMEEALSHAERILNDNSK